MPSIFTPVEMTKRRAAPASGQGKRSRGSTSASSRVIDNSDDEKNAPCSQPKNVRYANVMSTVTAAGVRIHITTFSTAPASPVKKRTHSEEHDSAFDFTGTLFGSVREPIVTDHDFNSFSAAFAEEFPTENPPDVQERKKRVRRIEVCLVVS